MNTCTRRIVAIAGMVATLTAGTVVAVAALGPEQAEGFLPEREAEVVVLTGADLPGWSRLAAVGAASPWPSGALDGVRDAHNGTIQIPPDAREGADPDAIAAYRWDGDDFVEVPVQVDQRFPHFLANANSDFGIYSATDYELTYQWDIESWRKTAGVCAAAFPDGEAPFTPDPVPALDDDDEIVFHASDVGDQAPADAAGPAGSGLTRQEVAVVDPTSGAVGYVYLFQRHGGSSFDADNGYVDYERHHDADEYVDRFSFRSDDPEKFGTSNRGYGANLAGPVCRTAQETGFPQVPDGEPRDSDDRQPRDGVTVRTDAYEFTASGRWMLRELKVAKPDQPGAYGPDLLDRWKGRAFQSSPDSSISVVGFEDEQVNWELNSTLLGERTGPVRAIREVWGADSGTNVTKTEYFYRDAMARRYRLRVHPIPPDGLYTAWDYNRGVATTYFNALNPEGVAIDGVNDDVGQVDDVAGQPAFFDAADPTFDLPSALLRWEQVSGAGDAGSLVYIFENKGPTSPGNPAIVPYYRDDACFDDGTGDDPVARPWPGESSTDQRVRDSYSANAGLPYDEVPCELLQGAHGSHGVHFFFTGDTDNAFVSPVPTTEVDGQEWQFVVPTAAPTNVGESRAQIVRAPLEAVVTEQVSTPSADPAPTAVSIPDGQAGQASDDGVLEARLTSDGKPVPGAELVFDLAGDISTGVTDSLGMAEVEVTFDGPAGSQSLTVAFAGSERLEPSEARSAVLVEPEATVVSFRADRQANQLRFDGSLTDHDGSSVPSGRQVSVVIDGDQVGEMLVDDDGQFGGVLDSRLRPGDEMSVSFAGDQTYRPATATATAGSTSAEGSSGSIEDPPDDESLRLNDIQVRGTHNSTHRDPKGVVTDGAPFGWGYSHRTLTGQFEEQAVRQVEIDVHYNWAKDDFDVYHVWFGDDRATCDTLTDCLSEIKAWSDAHPDSAPIMALIEPKDSGFPYSLTSGSTDPESHLPEDGDPFTKPLDAAAYARLDQILRDSFGGSIREGGRVITPDDLTVDGETLRSSITTAGWPTLDEVRGHVMFVLDGGAYDIYTDDDSSLAGRTMFVQADERSPLAAFVSRGGTGLPGEGKYDRIARLVGMGFMVRDLVSPDGFDVAKASGAQFLSTDFPEQLVLSTNPEAVGRCNPITVVVFDRACADTDIERHSGHDYPVPDDPSDEYDQVLIDKVDRVVLGSAESGLAVTEGKPGERTPIP